MQYAHGTKMDQAAGRSLGRLFFGKVSFPREESLNFLTVSLVANILSGILAAYINYMNFSM